MADCTKYRELLSGFVDNALTEAEKTELTAHLKGCAACRALLAVYRDVANAAEESMAEPPADFAAGVMQRIKALDSPDGKVSNIAAGRARTKKSYKPVIISFVAAAACLALAFIVTPQLFQFGGSGKTASMADAPAAEAAPEAYSLQAQVQPSAAPAAGTDIALKATESDAGHGDAVRPESTENPGGGAPDAMTGIMASPVPSAAPSYSGVDGLPHVKNWTTEDLTEYYAVITISGQLPELLAVNARVDNGNGTYTIEVTVDIADQLVRDGYTAEPGNAEKTKVLVIYTP